MKKERIAGFIACALILNAACKPFVQPQEEENEETSILELKMDEASFKKAVIISEESSGADVKSQIKLPDTSSYLLCIMNSAGDTLYSGLYSARPEKLVVSPGTYTVKAASRKFIEPEYDTPLFGDEQKIKIKADSTARVALVSSQLTGGIRLLFTKKFMSYFKGPALYVVGNTSKMKYFYYSASKYVFFYPGNISVVYKNKDGDESYTPDDNAAYSDTTLLTRKIKATEMVSITLDYDISVIGKTGLTIAEDTARQWITDYFNVADIAPYGCSSVLEATKSIGDTVMVFGYIVGGDLSSKDFRRKAPFTSKTHIAVASKSWQTLRKNCLGVELPASGKARQVLNLQDHPELLKRPVVVQGLIVDSYFGYPGMKSLKYYLLL